MIEALRHRLYLWNQWRQGHAKRAKDASFRLDVYIAELKRWMGDLPAGEILSLGPRNAIELDALAQAFDRKVVGLDLFSLDHRIKVGDMHQMPFEKNQFALVFASHVLEHARKPAMVMAEIARVLKSSGILFFAYPDNPHPTWHDLQDYGAPENLVELFPKWVRRAPCWYARRADAEWLGAVQIFKPGSEWF
jgi:SAM-dependent methyltransferase